MQNKEYIRKQLIALKHKHSKNLMQKHKLRGMGVGFKIIDGKRTDILSVVFIVEKKLPKKDVPLDKLLPSKLNGYDCDVVEMKKVTALGYTTKVRPAIPGYSIGHFDVTAGTFGCIVYQGALKLILSNNHVLADTNFGHVGDAIYQPGVYDGGTSSDTVAYLDSWVFLTDYVTADCALARVTNDALVTNVGVWGNSINTYSTPSLGDTVYKSGRTTGDTSGTIIYEHVDIVVEYETGYITIADCFVTDNSMSAGGDSGSIGRSSDTNAVGLLFAGTATESIFNYMSNVVSSLNFTFAPQAVTTTDSTFTNDAIIELAEPQTSSTSVVFNTLNITGVTYITENTTQDNEPTRQIASYKISRRDGEKFVNAYYGKKEITVNGYIQASTQQKFEEKVDSLKKIFSKKSGNLDITYSGKTRRYIATVENLQVNRDSYNTDWSSFSIKFLVPDGKGYDTNTTTTTYPTITTTPVSGTFTNTGSADAFPIVTITVNSQTSLTSLTLSDGVRSLTINNTFNNLDVVTINFSTFVIEKNGGQVTYTGAFPFFPVGSTTFTLSSVATARNLTLSFTYDSSYL